MITTAPRPVTQFGMANRSPMHQAATTENTEGTEHGRRSLTVPIRGTAEVPQGKGFRSDSVVSVASVVNILRLRSVSDRSGPQDLEAANRTVEYLTRYANRVAISNSRLIAIEGGQQMTPDIEDFIFNKPNLLASLNLLENMRLHEGIGFEPPTILHQSPQRFQCVLLSPLFLSETSSRIAACANRRSTHRGKPPRPYL